MSIKLDKPQHLIALDRANKLRLFRANIKRDLKSGKIKIEEILLDPPPELENMKIEELLLAIPRFGSDRVGKLLESYAMSPTITIRDLSSQRRIGLVRKINRR